jgi:hypothetical protein
MAGTITIGNLPLQSVVFDNTAFPVETANVTYKISATALKSYMSSNVASLTTSGLITASGGISASYLVASANVTAGNVIAGTITGITIGNAASTLTGTISTANQPNITGLGTVSSGTWTAAVVSPAYGGTGVNNGNNTLTVSGASFINQDVRVSGSPSFNAITATTINGGGTGIIGTAPGLSIGGLAATATLAASATKLATARAINGVNFDGTADISISAIAAANTLTGTTLAPGIVSSGLTSVGTLVGLNVSGAILPSTNGTINLGSAGNKFATIYGLATSAQYADLAENYVADAVYEPGTVVAFGGIAEITVHSESHCPHVAGVVSTAPAYLMNSATAGLPVALAGRVPCKVMGPVVKGDRLVNAGAGYAGKLDKTKYDPGCGIGYALEDHTAATIKLIEVAVLKF